MLAPASSAARATAPFDVSMLTNARSPTASATARTTGIARAVSVASSTDGRSPYAVRGRVDSAPTSRISAPAATKPIACSTAEVTTSSMPRSGVASPSPENEPGSRSGSHHPRPLTQVSRGSISAPHRFRSACRGSPRRGRERSGDDHRVAVGHGQRRGGVRGRMRARAAQDRHARASVAGSWAPGSSTEVKTNRGQLARARGGRRGPLRPHRAEDDRRAPDAEIVERLGQRRRPCRVVGTVEQDSMAEGGAVDHFEPAGPTRVRWRHGAEPPRRRRRPSARRVRRSPRGPRPRSAPDVGRAARSRGRPAAARSGRPRRCLPSRFAQRGAIWLAWSGASQRDVQRGRPVKDRAQPTTGGAGHGHVTGLDDRGLLTPIAARVGPRIASWSSWTS